MDTMEQSTVKWFDAKKGYGFINHPDGGDDIFVHYSQIESDDDFKTLHTGQTVRFELNDGPKGLHAAQVRIQDGAQNEDYVGDDSSLSGDGDAASAPSSRDVSIPKETSSSIESSM
jgi:CspA family cold shock protein